jgi:outer membrane immunogenic protein
MRRIALSVLAISSIVGSSAALAADLPPAAPPPPRAPAAYIPAPPPPFTWTGFYIGINGGYGWGRDATNDGAGNTPTLNSNGGLVGGTLGFNYQISQFVIGVEGDIDYSMMKFSQTATGAGAFGFGAATSSLTYKNDLLSTFAARFGFAADRALFYAKAGGAWTNEKITLSGTDPVFGTLSGSNSFSRLGWMVGGGIEYAVWDNLTLKAEYNYLDFGSKNENLTANFSVAGPFTATISSKLTASVVKVGLNWLFNM